MHHAFSAHQKIMDEAWKGEQRMSKFKRYALISIVLLIAAICFIVYAVTHPESSFPWSNTLTYLLYGLYGVLTGIMCGLTYKNRRKP